jgi:hypothetical protein
MEDQSHAASRRHGTKPVYYRYASMLEQSKDPPPKPPDVPVPGPHARPELLDPEKTPGAGTLPEPDDPNPSPTG